MSFVARSSFLLHASTFPIFSTLSLCQFSWHQLTEPLRNRCTEEMHQFVICYSLGVSVLWVFSQRLIGFPREIYFHERRKLRQITAVRPWSWDTGLLFSVHVEEKAPQLQKQSCFNPSHSFPVWKITNETKFFSVNRMCMITAVHIFILMKGCTFNCKIY